MGSLHCSLFRQIFVGLLSSLLVSLLLLGRFRFGVRVCVGLPCCPSSATRLSACSFVVLLSCWLWSCWLSFLHQYLQQFPGLPSSVSRGGRTPYSPCVCLNSTCEEGERTRRRCDVVGRRIPFRHFMPRLRQVMPELPTLASRNQRGGWVVGPFLHGPHPPHLVGWKGPTGGATSTPTARAFTVKSSTNKAEQNLLVHRCFFLVTRCTSDHWRGN